MPLALPKTPALMYRLARMAFAAPFVSLPDDAEGRVPGSLSRDARISASTNLKTESRDPKAHCAALIALVTASSARVVPNRASNAAKNY